MGLRLRVCDLTEVSEELQSFAVEGVLVPILVVRVDEEIIAGTSMCPHEDVSLVDGSLQGNTIVCSAHGYAFDLASGQCSHDPTLQWRRYKTIVHSNALWVDLL